MGNKNKEKELATQEENKEVALPNSWFEENMALGMEDLDSSDIPVPTLYLIQSNSKARDDDGRPYIPGKFFYKPLKKAYDIVNAHILSIQKDTRPSFANREVMESTYILFGVIMPEYLPFRLFCKGYGYGAVKRLNGEVKAYRKPLFTLNIKIGSTQKENEKGNFFVPEFYINNFETDSDKLMTLFELAKQFSDNRDKLKTDAVTELKSEGNPEDLPFS